MQQLVGAGLSAAISLAAAFRARTLPMDTGACCTDVLAVRACHHSHQHEPIEPNLA